MDETNAKSTGNGEGGIRKALQFSVFTDFAMLAAMVTMCVWVGRQAERIDAGVKSDQQQAAAFEELQKQVTTVSGQVLQMTSASNMAVAEQRLSVAETKIEAQEQFTREMKSDIVTRLNRIETKLDQSR